MTSVQPRAAGGGAAAGILALLGGLFAAVVVLGELTSVTVRAFGAVAVGFGLAEIGTLLVGSVVLFSGWELGRRLVLGGCAVRFAAAVLIAVEGGITDPAGDGVPNAIGNGPLFAVPAFGTMLLALAPSTRAYLDWRRAERLPDGWKRTEWGSR